MRRREFIAFAGGAVAAWPSCAGAQQPERMRRVGVLMGIAESDPAQQSFVSAFTAALQELGWQPGRNIQIDYRWGAGDADKIMNRIEGQLAMLSARAQTLLSLAAVITLSDISGPYD